MARHSSPGDKRGVSSFWLLANIVVVFLATTMFASFSTARDKDEWSAAEAIVGEKCKSCHGFDGLAEEESWPNLNCQNRGYLYSRMMHLRNGKEHEIDDSLKGLNISEIGKIAEYYASQPCKKRY